MSCHREPPMTKPHVVEHPDDLIVDRVYVVKCIYRGTNEIKKYRVVFKKLIVHNRNLHLVAELHHMTVYINWANVIEVIEHEQT